MDGIDLALVGSNKATDLTYFHCLHILPTDISLFHTLPHHPMVLWSNGLTLFLLSSDFGIFFHFARAVLLQQGCPLPNPRPLSCWLCPTMLLWWSAAVAFWTALFDVHFRLVDRVGTVALITLSSDKCHLRLALVHFKLLRKTGKGQLEKPLTIQSCAAHASRDT